MIEPDKYPPYPKWYLHVRECRSGEEWIRPLLGNCIVDLRYQLKKWIRDEFVGQYRMDGDLMARLEGDYYAQIKREREPPESIGCWESGGFYLVDR